METKKQTARQIFKNVVIGKNFMTPFIIGYYKIKNGAAELSKGEGFTKLPMYGVTIVKDNIHNHDLSKSFNSEFKAKEYIKSLK